MTTTGLGCLALNEAWEGFRARGQLPASTPDPIDMGMLLRRQLILLQLYRIFACRPRLPPIRLLVLGVGRDDQFVRLATNPELHVTCVDKPVVVEETRGRHGRADFKGMDII
ncbi:MAG: hypothetical protein Q8P67_21530, partial [archaeon]|nr:hypothetical protein [archaeon]